MKNWRKPILTGRDLKKLKNKLARFDDETIGDLKMEISKSDWKLYREKIAGWQENYMSRLNNEYIALLNADDKKASEKFWELEKRIKNDRRHPGVIIEMSKSNAVFDIVSLIRLGVITYDDLADFSDGLQEAVNMLSVKLR